MPETPVRNGLPESAPVFPLPNVVLFPHAILPLHIFEPRYRKMVESAVEGDGYIAMALLRPGRESDDEAPESYHGVGCLGKMTDLVRTPDGRYYLKLVGLRKVAFGEEVESAPFRRARIRAIDETVPPEGDPASHGELTRLLGICGVLVQEVSEKPFAMVSIKEGLPYESVVNSICFHVGLPPETKQDLLEVDDLKERCRRVTELMESHLQKIVLSRELDGETDVTETVN